MSSIKRDSTDMRRACCAKFLYGFKAARRAARAADSARSPLLPLALPHRRRLAQVGWREKPEGTFKPQASRKLGSATDLTREPSRWPRSG